MTTDSLYTTRHSSRKVLGFVLNPIAGMGGRVGLKGTDGPEVLEEALRRGATARAHERAGAALKLLARHTLWSGEAPPLWLACGGPMGAAVLEAAGFGGPAHRIIYRPSAKQTAARDTQLAVRAMVQAGAELVVFCGGDGTARDVMEGLATQEREGPGAGAGAGNRLTPSMVVVGIPAGVKMHSAVFGASPSAAAELMELWLTGRAGLREAEVMDVDEAAFRENRLAVSLHGHLRVPYHADLLQGCKCVYGGEDEQEAIEGLIETLLKEAEAAKEAEAEPLWLLGPGSTVARVKEVLGLTEPTMLGVDALAPGGKAHHDLDEAGLLALLEEYKQARLVVSPIGAQGFLFGRGNQQLSPKVLASLGKENIRAVASPHKMKETPRLLLDTGRRELDEALTGYYKVLVSFETYRMTLVEAAGNSA